MFVGTPPPTWGAQSVYIVQLDVDDALPCYALQGGVLVQQIHVALCLRFGNGLHLIFVHRMVCHLQPAFCL